MSNSYLQSLGHYKSSDVPMNASSSPMKYTHVKIAFSYNMQSLITGKEVYTVPWNGTIHNMWVEIVTPWNTISGGAMCGVYVNNFKHNMLLSMGSALPDVQGLVGIIMSATSPKIDIQHLVDLSTAQKAVEDAIMTAKSVTPHDVNEASYVDLVTSAEGLKTLLETSVKPHEFTKLVLNYLENMYTAVTNTIYYTQNKVEMAISACSGSSFKMHAYVSLAISIGDMIKVLTGISSDEQEIAAEINNLHMDTCAVTDIIKNIQHGVKLTQPSSSGVKVNAGSLIFSSGNVSFDKYEPVTLVVSKDGKPMTSLGHTTDGSAILHLIVSAS